MEAREEKEGVALLTPLVIVFYSSEDVLKDSSLGFFRRLYKYLVNRLIEIVLNSRYSHVQVYRLEETNYVPSHGKTRIYYRDWRRTPFSIAYIIHPTLYCEQLYYAPRQVSLWKNLKWVFGLYKRMPVNCISDAEMLLRMHLTHESNNACKARRTCRTIEEVEEAIRTFRFGLHWYRVQMPDEYR